MTKKNKCQIEKKCNCICHHSPGVQPYVGQKTECKHCKIKHTKKVKKIETFTKEEMADWILDNWKGLLPILKEQERYEVEKQQRHEDFISKLK